MKNNDKVPELTSNEFDEFIEKGLVLIDFFARWCMPCVTMSPVVDELAEKFLGKIKFGKVNIENNQEIAQRFKVSSIPNFVLLKDKEVITQFTGAIGIEDFTEKLNKYL